MFKIGDFVLFSLASGESGSGHVLAIDIGRGIYLVETSAGMVAVPETCIVGQVL